MAIKRPARQKITVSWEWKLLGEVELSSTGVVKTPLAPYRTPGVYRLIMRGPRITHVYLGESENLRHRIAGHRRGGRAHELMKQCLAAGGRVEIHLADRVRFGNLKAFGMDRKTVRLFIEGAAVMQVNLNQEGVLINAD